MCALCFRISCSRYSMVLLWCTLCLSWTYACHVWGVHIYLQSSHCWFPILNSTTKVYCKIVPFSISFWISSLILILLEWGSVQINWASRSLIAFIPLSFLRHIARSSALSHSGATHLVWDCMYLLHSRQCSIRLSLEIVSVMSILFLRQAMHVLDGLGVVITPQRQHLILWASIFIAITS